MEEVRGRRMRDCKEILECTVTIDEDGVIRLGGHLIGRLLGNIPFRYIEDALEYLEEEND